MSQRRNVATDTDLKKRRYTGKYREICELLWQGLKGNACLFI